MVDQKGKNLRLLKKQAKKIKASLTTASMETTHSASCDTSSNPEATGKVIIKKKSKVRVYWSKNWGIILGIIAIIATLFVGFPALYEFYYKHFVGPKIGFTVYTITSASGYTAPTNMKAEKVLITGKLFNDNDVPLFPLGFSLTVNYPNSKWIDTASAEPYIPWKEDSIFKDRSTFQAPHLQSVNLASTSKLISTDPKPGAFLFVFPFRTDLTEEDNENMTFTLSCIDNKGKSYSIKLDAVPRGMLPTGHFKIPIPPFN